MIVQNSTSEIHSKKTVQSTSFVAHETWGTRQGQFEYFLTCNSSFLYKKNVLSLG